MSVEKIPFPVEVNLKRRHQLSVRLMLATLLSSLVVAILVSAAQIYVTYLQGVESAQERLNQIESSHIPSLNAALWTLNTEQIDTLLNGIAQLPDVGFVQLTDVEGKLTQRNAPAEEHPLLSKKFILESGEDSHRVKVGELYVESSQRDIFASIRNRAIGIAITTLITLLLSSVVIFLLFQRWVTRHLESMAMFAQKFNINNLDQRLVLNREHSSSDDELDMVVNAINHMQASLKNDLQLRMAIEQELRAHKDNLEMMVEKRTLELNVKNQILEAQASELAAQNQELDAYAHSVAHDLKTPLTTILARAQVLNTIGASLSPNQTQESVESIHRTAQKMNTIINELLLLASIRRAEDIPFDVIDMKVIIEEACERLYQQASDRKATISCIGDWSSCNAKGYAPWIEEVCVNYISNAIKYGGSLPRIEIGFTKELSGLNKYWVRDFGEGISAESQKKLFVQFSRLDPAASEGHGLGLSIVKRIVERLQGEVGYEKLEDGGGRFWFSLPASELQITSDSSQYF